MTPLPTDREILPVLVLADGVLFPGMRRRVLLGTLRAYGAIVEATRAGAEANLAVFASRGLLGTEPGETAQFDVGCLARVISLARCHGKWVADIDAVGRVRSTEELRQHPFRLAWVERIAEPSEDPDVIAAMVSAVRTTARRLVRSKLEAGAVRCALQQLQEASDEAIPGAALALLGAMPIAEQQRALELGSLTDRLDFVLLTMGRLLDAPSV
jgi:Lon protease-like protein